MTRCLCGRGRAIPGMREADCEMNFPQASTHAHSHTHTQTYARIGIVASPRAGLRLIPDESGPLPDSRIGRVGRGVARDRRMNILVTPLYKLKSFLRYRGYCAGNFTGVKLNSGDLCFVIPLRSPSGVIVYLAARLSQLNSQRSQVFELLIPLLAAPNIAMITRSQLDYRRG